MELTATVISADGLHTQRSNAIFLREVKGAHFVFQVLGNQPNLFAQLDTLNWQAVPVAVRTEARDRGRHEVRTIRVLDAPAGVLFPYVAQVFLVERKITLAGETSYESVLYVTSLSATQAGPADLLAYVRAHWTIENRVHWVRDVTLGEDASRVRTGNAPRVMAAYEISSSACYDSTGSPTSPPGYATTPATTVASLHTWRSDQPEPTLP